MEFFASPELQAAIANIVLLVITGITGAIAKAVYSFITTHTSANQFALLEALASSAVYAAEQKAVAGLITDKKAAAEAIVNEGLKNAGITGLTAAQIGNAIEAAVKENLNFNKVVVKTTDPDVEVTVAPGGTPAPDVEVDPEADNLG